MMESKELQERALQNKCTAHFKRVESAERSIELAKEEYRQQVENINKIHDLEVKEVNKKRHRVINELFQVHKKRMHGLDRELKEQGFLYTKSVLDLSNLQGTDGNI